MIEIEQRYKLYDVGEFMRTLENAGIQPVKTNRLIDEWFAPLYIKSHERQREWFDGEHGIAYRIRRQQQSDDTFTVAVETKQLTADDNHNSFHETVVPITDYEEAEMFLASNGYWNWLTIDKTRRMFDSPDSELELVIDEIEGLAEKIGVGAALEIEYKGSADRDKALEKITALASRLGLGEDQLFAKSLTVEAMSELAKFE